MTGPDFTISEDEREALAWASRAHVLRRARLLRKRGETTFWRSPDGGGNHADDIVRGLLMRHFLRRVDSDTVSITTAGAHALALDDGGRVA